MEEVVHKHKSYEAPSVSPYTLRALAIAHYLYASFTFVALAIGNVVDGSGIDKELAGAVASINSPQAKSMKRTLQRTGDIKDSLKQHMSRQLPSSVWIEPANQTLNVSLAVLLLAAGSFLSQRRPIGRTLSLVFAAVCFAQQIGMMAWQQLAEIPTARQYLEQLIRLYPADVDIIRGILTPISNGPTFHLLIAVYPISVFALMVQPGVKELLNPAQPNNELPNDLPTAQRRIAPELGSSSNGPDPLEALLQRKTF